MAAKNEKKLTYTAYKSGNGSQSTEWRMASATNQFLTSWGWDGVSTNFSASDESGNWVVIQEIEFD